MVEYPRRVYEPNDTGAAIGVLLGVAGAAGAAVAVFPPIPQDPAYHRFADIAAVWRSVPNAWNVLSNLAFLLVGLWDCGGSQRAPTGPGAGFIDARERWPYALFFAGVALTGWARPTITGRRTTPRLVWDRLPMTIGFMALLAAIVAERVERHRRPRRCWARSSRPELGSVIYWRAGELRGAGDLRPYALVQFCPLVLILLMLWLLPAALHWRRLSPWRARHLRRGQGPRSSWTGRIFSRVLVLSGHTLKHLPVALAA